MGAELIVCWLDAQGLNCDYLCYHALLDYSIFFWWGWP